MIINSLIILWLSLLSCKVLPFCHRFFLLLFTLFLFFYFDSIYPSNRWFSMRLGYHSTCSVTCIKWREAKKTPTGTNYCKVIAICKFAFFCALCFLFKEIFIWFYYFKSFIRHYQPYSATTTTHRYLVWTIRSNQIDWCIKIINYTTIQYKFLYLGGYNMVCTW